MTAEVLPKRVFECVLPIAPVAKARARVTKFGAFTPKKTKDFETNVFWLLRDAKAPLFTGAVWVRATFVIEPPARMPKGRVFPTVRNDLDNYAKALMDGMNGVVFPDDCAVVHLDVRKEYGSPARIELEVGEI